VAINEQSFVGVAWADQSRQDIFFQIYEPDGKMRFEDSVNVSGSPRIFSWLPRMVIASGDASDVYILWQEIVFSGGSHGGEIFFARSTDGGKTFSDPVNLSNSIAGDGKGRLTRRYWHNGSLDLAMGPQGSCRNRARNRGRPDHRDRQFSRLDGLAPMSDTRPHLAR